MLLLTAGITSYGQEHMFVFLNKKMTSAELPKEQLDKIMEGHMANITRLAKEKKLVAAGPFEGGGGLFIFKSNSKNQVEEWLGTDPGVQAHRWDVEIHPYTPRKSSLCTAPEPYEMTMYNFIRYEVNISKDTFSESTQAINEHNQYLKNLYNDPDTIAEAVFGSDEGGILIMKGDLKKEIIEKDPAVQKQVVSVTYKKLYIAKGSFCEK
ncbi:hypothetical protein BH10BAC4_BH10BAC4_21490 [soil metagenome]